MFLYVLLNDCVLVAPSIEMDELFCDPLAGTTLLLPWDFSLAIYNNFSINIPLRATTICGEQGV
jgi:hypothetical protein